MAASIGVDGTVRNPEASQLSQLPRAPEELGTCCRCVDRSHHTSKMADQSATAEPGVPSAQPRPEAAGAADPPNSSSSGSPGGGSQQEPASGSAESPLSVGENAPTNAANPLPVHPSPAPARPSFPLPPAQNGGLPSPLAGGGHPAPVASSPGPVPLPPAAPSGSGSGRVHPPAPGGGGRGVGGRGRQSSAWVAGGAGAGAAGRGRTAPGRGGVVAHGALPLNWPQGPGTQYLGGGGSAAARQLPPKRPRVEQQQTAKKHTLYNKRCVKCNGVEVESRRRSKLCKNNQNCRRWVHRGEMKGYNVSVQDRSATCCVHFNIIDCECLK